MLYGRDSCSYSRITHNAVYCVDTKKSLTRAMLDRPQRNYPDASIRVVTTIVNAINYETLACVCMCVPQMVVVSHFIASILWNTSLEKN